MKKIKALSVVVVIVLNASFAFDVSVFAGKTDSLPQMNAGNVINCNSFVQVFVQPAHALVKITNVLKHEILISKVKKNAIKKLPRNTAFNIFSQDKLFSGSKKFLDLPDEYCFYALGAGNTFENMFYKFLFISIFLLFIVILRRSSLPALSLLKQIQKNTTF